MSKDKNQETVNEICKNIYNKMSEEYVKIAEGDWRDKSRIDGFLKDIPMNSDVLDLGCGTGILSRYICDKGYKVTAVDYSEKMVELTKDLVNQVEVYEMEFQDINKLNKKFSGICAAFSLGNIPKTEIKEVLKKLYDILTVQGPIFISLIYGKTEKWESLLLMPSEKMYFARYTDSEIKDIMESVGFKIKTIHIQKRPTSKSTKAIYINATK